MNIDCGKNEDLFDVWDFFTVNWLSSRKLQYLEICESIAWLIPKFENTDRILDILKTRTISSFRLMFHFWSK